jgi:hypothetical protein
MMLRIVALAFPVLTGCSTMGTPGPTEAGVRTASQADVSVSGEQSLSSIPGLAAAINDQPSTVGAGPRTEHALGYVLLVTEVIVLAGVAIGIFKLSKMFGH